MKKISLLFAFVALFATVSFAGTSDTREIKSKPAIDKTIIEPFVAKVCSITATWTNGEGGQSTVTISVTCSTCTTTQQACNQAYALLSLIIPGA